MTGRFKEFRCRFSRLCDGPDPPEELRPPVFRIRGKGLKVARRGNGWALKGAAGTVSIPSGRDRPEGRFGERVGEAEDPVVEASQKARIVASGIVLGKIKSRAAS